MKRGQLSGFCPSCLHKFYCSNVAETKPGKQIKIKLERQKTLKVNNKDIKGRDFFVILLIEGLFLFVA